MRVFYVFGILIVCALPLYLRAHYEADRNLRAALLFETQGNIPEAAEHYRRAALWRFPTVNSADEGLEHLEELSHDRNLSAEQRLIAKRELYRAYMSARRIGESRSEQQIQELREQLADGSSLREVEGQAPSFLFQILMQIFFWGWIGAVLTTLWRAVTPEGVIVWSRAIPGAGVAVGAFALWLYFLSLA